MSTMSSGIPGFSGEAIGAAAVFAGSGGAGDDANPEMVIERLNGLLRGEISAAETFRNVLGKAAAGEHLDKLAMLSDLHADHGRACQLIRERIVELGGEAADSSGAWGVWAQAVQGTMTLFGGDRGGLRALIEGEEHGLKDYEKAVNEVDPASAQLIQNVLIPTAGKHISVLDRLLESSNQ